jgi:hypothetical protein
MQPQCERDKHHSAIGLRELSLRIQRLEWHRKHDCVLSRLANVGLVTFIGSEYVSFTGRTLP